MSEPSPKGDPTYPHREDDGWLNIDPAAGHAAELAVRAWEGYLSSISPIDQSRALVDLSDAMFGLSTWLPDEGES